MMSHLLLMKSCHTSLDHLSSGVLILGSRLLRFLRLHICFLELRVIPCGLSLISTPSLWSDVCFSTAFMSGASISFPHLFLCSLNEVHRSSTIGHVLIYPIFIHRILLFLGLADFPTSEPVHVVGPLGATFLQQRAAHLRADPSVSRGASSSSVPPPPSSTGAAETSGGGGAATDVPPLTTSDDLDIQRMLDHVLTVQAAQGQILVDILDEIRGLRADLARFRSSSSPPPFDDGF